MTEARLGRRSKTVITVISKIAERQALPNGCLVTIYGVDLGKRFTLDRPELIIGRSTQCEILVDQESVSRQHARILVTPRETAVKDLNSTNGTYVNDELVADRDLRDGDYIKIGRTIFKYLTGNNVEQAYHEEIYRLTTVDGLTHTFNQRYLTEQLTRELSRSARYGRPLSLVVFDVDDFQQINEEHGHLAGDSLLTQVCHHLRGNIRREDLMARMHGDTFCFLLPETDQERARQFAEKIRRNVEDGAFAFEGVSLKVTISLGLASASGAAPHPPPEGLLEMAKDNLALAKKLGRNRLAG